MARIRHIAIASDDPGSAAEFFKNAFGLTEVRRDPKGSAVGLTDGRTELDVHQVRERSNRRGSRLSRHPSLRRCRSTTSTNIPRCSKAWARLASRAATQFRPAPISRSSFVDRTASSSTSPIARGRARSDEGARRARVRRRPAARRARRGARSNGRTRAARGLHRGRR